LVEALLFCARQQQNLMMLIESAITPDQVEEILPVILSGNSLKYIVDFRPSPHQRIAPVATKGNTEVEQTARRTNPSSFLETLIRRIELPPDDMKNMAQKKVDLKTKPLGALGRIEELAVQLSAIQRSLNPTIDCRRMFVFAGDHGVVEEGVSAFPAKVTVQMGIGNTSSASAIICAVTGLTPEQVVGRGTGVDDRGLERKREAIEKALALHDLSGSDGLALLRTIGGYELGGICGAVIAAASEGCCVVSSLPSAKEKEAQSVKEKIDKGIK